MRHAMFLALAGLACLSIPAAAADPAEPAAAPPRTRLLSPGRPPLRPLRYAIPAGHRGTVVMTIKMAMAMKLDGQALPAAPTPTMRCTFDYRVTALTPAGDIRYEFEFGAFEAVASADVPAPVLEATRGALAGIRGLRGHAVVTSRGITREADITVPADASPALRATIDSLRQSMNQFSAPLPEEAVGEGARWETLYNLTQNGITIEQTAVNDLAALKGDRGKLGIAITQTAPPQRVALPASGEQAKADLVSLASKGEGATEFDLARLAPTSARVTLKMLMKMRIQVGAQKAQDMDMTMDMDMGVTGR